MKKAILASIILLFGGLEAKSQTIEENVPEFTKILDNLHVEGSILIVDSKNKTAYSNDFRWANQKRIPASTFKIPNSIIALQLKIVKDEHTILKWNGQKRNNSIWEKDMTLKEAFQSSCVPCFQEIAGKIGLKRMREYLDKLEYPGMEFDQSTLLNFWLEGTSGISQVEQIEFLNRLYFSKLPITRKTEKVIKNIMEIERNGDCILSGKTGWGIRDGNNIGWFVGYMENGGHLYFFATNIRPKNEINISDFPSARIKATKEALKLLEASKK